MEDGNEFKPHQNADSFHLPFVVVYEAEHLDFFEKRTYDTYPGLSTVV